MMPALVLSGLLNLVTGGHIIKSFLAPDLPEEKYEEVQDHLPPPYSSYSSYYSSPWDGEATGEGELMRGEEEEEGEEEGEGLGEGVEEQQRFQDMYTQDAYYNLPRSLQQPYHQIL